MLNRDARHLALSQVGHAGQQRIAAGTVLLIGAGGIGCAAAAYLASSGIGHLKIADFDTVDATNLGRQVLYTPDDVGKLKVDVAAERLRAMNPDTRLTPISERLQRKALADEVASSDLVLDGCDNFATRFQVNDACVAARRRLISGSALRLEGQLAVFGPDYASTPCYRCLYAEADESMDSCAGNGVLAPIPGVIGTMMAVEALKYFSGIESDTSALHLYDAAATAFQKLRIQKRKNCPACATCDAT
jgi:molybdopterin/thiamine biosynthesis adenylyltransferase